MSLPDISHAAGSRVVTADGRSMIDLVSGFGAVFLGHCHPKIVARLQAQLGRVWACARYPHAPLAEAQQAIETLLPEGYAFGGMGSTGMEIAEFAMRIAARHTGRREFVGFASSMHGKSSLTAALGWHNAPVGSAQAHLLPFVGTASEEEILERLSALLGGGTIAAVFVEPIQGSNGGHEASIGFHERLIEACRAHGTLVVYDEILTGLHRTGSCFYADRLAQQPDLLLFAKAMGHGFPASALALRAPLQVTPDSLPGSTFSGNPLAAAAVAATLHEMALLDMPAQVARIERTVRAAFAERPELGVALRGRGALWVLEGGPGMRLAEAVAAIARSGVLVSSHGRCIRLLPAATIAQPELEDACARIAEACRAACA